MKNIADYLGLHRRTPAQERRELNLRKVRTYITGNNLSTIPAILTRVNALCNDLNAGLDEFAAVYQMDKSSSARLVRTANSVLYAPREGKSVIGIRDALLRIGFAGAREILHASTVCGLYKAHSTIGDYSSTELWKHSMAVALATRLIYSEVLKTAEPPADPYLAGLLHDLGISIEHACLYHDGFAAAVIAHQERQDSLIITERQEMEITHPEIGLELGILWKFPESLMAVIGCHHAPNEAPDPVRQLVQAVRSAEWICREAGLGYSDIGENEADDYQAGLRQLGVEGDIYQQITTKLNAEFQALNALGWFTSLQLKR